MQTKREFYLDLIRIFSCLCILTIHFDAAVSGYSNGVFQYPNGIAPNFVINGVYLGGLGVSLFFMLSGAALMTAYKDGCKPISVFYKKRFFSIFPMFWLAFIISISFSLIINKAITGTPIYNLIFSILGFDGYFSSLGITGAGFYQVGEWFLGCLILLYLLYPLLSFGIRKKPIISIFVVILLYCACNFYFKVNSILFVVRIPELAFGMIFAKYYAQKRRMMWGGLLVLIIGIISFFYSKYIDPLSYQIIISACIFILLAFIAQLIKNKKIHDTFSHISKYTYAAFLVHHQLIAYLVRGFDLANFPKRQVVLLFIVYILLTSIISVLLYRANGRLTKRFIPIKKTEQQA